MKSQAILAKVISVCSEKDLQTWSIACKRILRHIKAEQYLLAVPDSEVDAFRQATQLPFQVIPESVYVGNLKDKLKQLLPTQNHDRIGWYLQQFIKIAAAKGDESQIDPNAVVLIWDADTVPLKDLVFIDSGNRILYYQGVECHEPYFAFIQKTLGISEKQGFSFIAQCLPAKIEWINAFCKKLETANLNWMEAILSNIDSSQRAGFSEYETLGAYIWASYPNNVALSSGIWERNGLSLVGKPDKLSEMQWQGLAKKFDFISFEGWDTNRGLRSSLRAWRRRVAFGKLGNASVHQDTSIY
jgi:hypothetical protein